MTLFASSLVFSHLSATLLKHNRGENNAIHSHAFIALSTRFNRCFCGPSTGRRSRQNVANDISGWISGFFQWACRIFYR